MQLIPAVDAIRERIPGIGIHRAYQIARAIRAAESGAIVPIGRRLYAHPERLDEVLLRGVSRVSAVDDRPAA